jgi:hypothetical protein
MKIKFVRASAGHRWWNCPGSVLAEQTAPPISGSEHALQGSTAHRLLELCLSRNKDAVEYEDMEIKLPREKIMRKVDSEMAEHIQDGLDLIRSLRGKGVLWTESEIIIKTKPAATGGVLDVGWHGQYLERNKKKPKKTWQLHILDLKYGRGAYTDPEENKQLSIYGLGKLLELRRLGKKVDTIHLWIYQPRLETAMGPFREVVLTPYQLEHEFRQELDEKVKAAAHPQAKRIPGPWCSYCAAHAVCREAEKANMRMFRTKFEENDRDRIGELLFQIPRFIQWCNAIKELGATMAGHHNLPTGWKQVPGNQYKRWKGDKEDLLKTIGKKLERLQLSYDDFAPRRLASPAAVLRMVDKDQKTKVEEMFFIQRGKPLLRPASDKRTEIDSTSYFEQEGGDDGLL